MVNLLEISRIKRRSRHNVERSFLCVRVLYFGWPNQPSSGIPEEGWFGQPKYSTRTHKKDLSTLCRLLLLFSLCENPNERGTSECGLLTQTTREYNPVPRTFYDVSCLLHVRREFSLK